MIFLLEDLKNYDKKENINWSDKLAWPANRVSTLDSMSCKTTIGHYLMYLSWKTRRMHIHDAVMWGQVRTRRANIIGGSYKWRRKTQHVLPYGWLFSEIEWMVTWIPPSSSWRALQGGHIIILIKNPNF